MDAAPMEGRMPPRAKSAVPVRDRRSFAAAPARDGPPRPKLLRRASMAALPQPESATPPRPALRRGSSIVPRRPTASSASGLNSGATPVRPPPRPRPLDAPAPPPPPSGAAPQEPPAVCGMCGNCGEGARAMPPWAPERLSKMSADERRRTLMQLHEREETGKISSAIRAKSLRNAQDAERKAQDAERNAQAAAPPAAAAAAAPTPPGPHRPRRGPAKTPLSALAKAESFRRRPSIDALAVMREESVDLVDAHRPPRRRAPERAEAKLPDARVAALGAAHMESIDLGSGESNEVEAFRNDGVTRRRAHADAGTPTSELEELGDDDGGDGELTALELQRSMLLDAFSVDVYAAEENVLDIDCAQCDDLEARVRDLEEQLGVLREVVKISEEGADKRESDVDSISTDDHTHPKKNRSWKDRVLGGYFGSSNTAGERTRLKQEVDALRKATNFLFSKLQESDEKRTREKKG